MAHHNTILSQIASFVPRHDFENLASIYHEGGKFRSFNRWSQFLAMMTAQLSSRKSLRDLADNLKVQQRRLYHLGMKPTHRATLARTNNSQPYMLYRMLFYKLFEQCRRVAPRHSFKFKGKIYLLDATMVELCLSIFPWATYRKSKGAMKLHFGLDIDGHLPVFMDMTKGKKHELAWAKTLNLPSGSCVVFDRGFTDYSWYQTLCKKNITFVTRLKSNANTYRFGNKRKPDSPDILSDQKIKLEDCRSDFRHIQYQDPETGRVYSYITNSLELPASEIASLYKERWQIECFFRWIKQQLKVKTFLGTSRNAVLTQLWIALCVYLLLAFLKSKAKTGWSMTKVLRLLQINLFEKRPLMELLKPPERQHPPDSKQLFIWNSL